jgi:hypothetical protein
MGPKASRDVTAQKASQVAMGSMEKKEPQDVMEKMAQQVRKDPRAITPK